MKQQAKYLLMNDPHVRKGETTHFKTNWEEAIWLCEQHGIKTIILGGDMFYSSSSQSLDVLMSVREVIRMCQMADIKIIAAWGNHDIASKKSEVSYLHLYSEHANFNVDKYHHIEEDTFDIWVMSYTLEQDGFREEYQQITKQLDSDKKNFLYIHEGVNGGLAHYNDTNKELPADMFKEFDEVWAGHYHDRCQVPNSNVMYIGASRQMNFGEDEEKGYTIVFDDGSTEFVKNESNLRFITLEVDIKQLDDDLLGQISDLKNNAYLVRLVINCKKNQVNTINKAQFVEAGASKVVVKAENEVVLKAEQTAFHRYDAAGIRNTYSEFCEQESLDCDLGLKYLKAI